VVTSYRESWRVCVFQERLQNYSKVILKETVTVQELLQCFLKQKIFWVTFYFSVSLLHTVTVSHSKSTLIKLYSYTEAKTP